MPGRPAGATPGVLAIDAGNTRIKLGSFDSGHWVRQSALATSAAGEFETQLHGLPAPGRIVVANVAGEAVGERIRQALQQYPVVPHWLAAAREQCGVRSSYAEPARLGADRWAALIGARRLFEGACVVINAGTTMTVDALSAEGVFIGGCIVPGVDLMRDALARNTAQLRLQEGRFQFFPDNTADAIVSGAINALAGAVERVARSLEKTAGASPLLILSGGNAPQLEHQLNGRVEVVDNLVLEGLLEIALDIEAHG